MAEDFVEMDVKSYLVPLGVALLVFGVTFLAVDVVIMNLQGLSLFFHQ